VIGKTVRLGTRLPPFVGVLEPSVPYPAETEIIANVVTSPHHLSATNGHRPGASHDRVIRPLAPGVDLEQARSELRAVHATMNPRPSRRLFTESRLPHRRRSPARPDHLWCANCSSRAARASGLIFVIACSNVANLILARHGSPRKASLPCALLSAQAPAPFAALCLPKASCSAALARCSVC